VPLDRMFARFVQSGQAAGVVLLACTLLALAIANSGLADSYHGLWHLEIAGMSAAHWINDGLMAVFFLLIGLELEREIYVGELSAPRNALLPLFAAAGGMAAPAAIHLALNGGTATQAGFGIPMATDIAFALGVLALLGERVPLQLKVFLTALAIVDDVGAVLVIAFFYTAELSWLSLGIGLLFLLAMFVANLAGVRQPVVYLLLGMVLWVAVLKSGIHATLAGVVSAMAIPARARIDAPALLRKGRGLLTEFERSSADGQNSFITEDQQSALAALETACEQVGTPLQRLEHALHPWVTFAIMPVFALANVGVALGSDPLGMVTNSVSLGIVAGLVVGKQIGVTLFAWLAVRSGIAALPAGISWRQIYGAGWLAGIGFTMSLFVAGLAFSDPQLLSVARLNTLLASVIAGVCGWLVLQQISSRSRASS